MSKPIFTGHEIGYEADGALDYFHDATDGRYLDDNKFKVVAHRYKEITDEDDEAQGLTDYEWTIDVYRKPYGETEGGNKLKQERIPNG